MKKDDELSPLPSNLEPRTSNLNWPRLYIGVLAFLAAQVALFYWFTKAFE